MARKTLPLSLIFSLLEFDLRAIYYSRPRDRHSCRISRNIWEFRGRRRSEKSEGEWNRRCRLFEWKSLYCFQIEYPKNRWKNRAPFVFVESACSATFIRSKPAELDVPCTELCKTVHLPRKTTNATSDRGELRYGFYRSSVPRRKRRASFTSASAVNFRADKSISSQWGVQTDELDFRSTQVFPFRIIGGRFVLDFDEANLWPSKYCVWTGRFKAIPFKSRDFFK